MRRIFFRAVCGVRVRAWFALLLPVFIFAMPAVVRAQGAEAGNSRPPLRLVSLVPAITETLFALGLGDRVVGVSTYCDEPAAARALPKVGTFSEPVAEGIVALAPDLVLTSPSPGNQSAVRAIERAGVKVAVVQGDGGLAEARAAILEVARAVGATAAGEALVADIDARLAAVRVAAEARSHPRVALVVGREPLVLAGPASFLGELAALAGAVNVADAVGGRWPRVGLEFLVHSSPQLVVNLASAMGEFEAGDAPGWASLGAAVRVVGVSDTSLLRPGPRLAEAAETLSKMFAEAGEAAGGRGATVPAEGSGAGQAARAEVVEAGRDAR